MGHRCAGQANPCGTNDVHVLGTGGSTAVETPESAPHTSCRIILVQWALGSWGMTTSSHMWVECVICSWMADLDRCSCSSDLSPLELCLRLQQQLYNRLTAGLIQVWEEKSQGPIPHFRSAYGHVEATEKVHKGRIVLSAWCSLILIVIVNPAMSFITGMFHSFSP